MVTGGTLSLGNGKGHEADRSPPTSVEDKKTWVYTSTPPHAMKTLYMRYMFYSCTFPASTRVLCWNVRFISFQTVIMCLIAVVPLFHPHIPPYTFSAH
jgi:hypothetical protein